jgi:hypothetical protein
MVAARYCGNRRHLVDFNDTNIAQERGYSRPESIARGGLLTSLVFGV